jgi:eukaryotic-like serine/threonine-protein kinase
MSLEVGQQLGSYEIVSLLGKGGMGEVYRARDSKLKRDVAIKVLPEEFSRDHDRVSRFQREAEVLASLNHTNIGSIYDLQEANGSRFLIMELVEGETLAERIQRGALPVDEALQIAKSICEALEAAHEKGIIHRDLKPSNVKILPDGKVKVLDFGLAKAVETSPANPAVSHSPTLSMAATNAGLILGTAAYMSPEQAKGRHVDRRTDIFAFGCVLYEMLTGRAAFDGEDVTDILSRILQREPDWTLLPSNVPARIRELLQLCLQKDVRKRRSDAADVRIDIEQALAAPPETTAVPAAPRSREWRAWIVSAALLIGIIALSVPAFRYFYEPTPPEMRLDIDTPLTSQPLEFALSPDGMRLAFVANDNGAQRLWVRPLDATEAQPLARTDGAAYPFWSPDSRSIGFYSAGKLKRIDIAGGTPQILADAPGFRGGTWNRDGVILFAPSPGSSLSRVSATGGTPEVVTHLEQGQTSHRFPQFLPEGTHFLFYVQAAAPDRAGIYLGSIDGNDAKRLVGSDGAGAWVAPGWLLYSQQGTLRAQQLDTSRGVLVGSPVTVADPVGYDVQFFNSGFSASSIGTLAYRVGGRARTQLTWFDRNGKTVGTVGDPDGSGIGYPELSPDGRRIAVDRAVQGNVDVWLIDLIRSGLTRFTFDAAVDRRPIWSLDGTQIVFGSDRKNNFDLYTKPSSGAGNEQLLLESPNQKTAFGWSSDGRFLLYGEDLLNKGRDLFALPMQGDRKPVVIVNSPFDERNPQFSPDGRWVAYHSDESGRFEVYVVPFPAGGGKWQVSTGGGISPRWRHDGKELFFIAPDGTMMVATVSISGTSFDAAPPVALFQTRIVGGGSNFLNKAQYAVSSDGRFLINVPAAESSTSPVTLLLNWNPERGK